MKAQPDRFIFHNNNYSPAGVKRGEERDTTKRQYYERCQKRMEPVKTVQYILKYLTQPKKK